ncbi:MAG: 2-oxo acid dehydrogenase subunit E2 [Deltaproteobacteria bacterium]|nr:2-oxo acid dehydrogenase subunit E2 [Deltaproteobacteria bacterium]
MAIIVDMPRLSDTMEEGTIAGWLKEVGQPVKAGDGLAEIETDKAVMVFESFDSGVLLALLLKAGDTVPLGTPMAILGKAGEDITALKAEAEAKVKAALAGPAAAPAKTEAPEPAKPESEKAAEPAKVETPEPAKAETPASAKVEAPKAAAATSPGKGGLAQDLSAPHDEDGARIAASPLARRLAIERGIDLGAVAGSGPRGRIVVQDLEGLVPKRKLSGRLAKAAKKEDEVVRVTQMRKTIAKRLVQSMQEAPHYYLTIEVDAGRLVALRQDLNSALELRAGPGQNDGQPGSARPSAGQKPQKVSFNDLVMRAVVVALGKHPGVNAGWEGATIRHFGGVHLGFAVALPEGLITPVIRDAQQLDLLELADATRVLAARARDGKLEAHEYAGNSFCVSNLGMFGIDAFTAVINPPAACILAVGALVEAAIVKNGQITPGHRLTLTLSSDHRAVDGAMGAAFMADLRKVLEAPTALLL